jgi:hypothetical protein
MFKAVQKGLNVVSICHRRSGKDVCCLQLWVLRALTRVGTHVYLFPQLNQARSVIWNGMDYSGKPFIDAIPNALIEYKNDARMEIRLSNGSRLVLGGSNNYNSLMGSNPVTIIYSEYALHHPLARQYLNPILIQNDGLEVINSTPRGKNHLFDVYDVVRDNPRYHIEHLSVKETFKHDGTPIITEQHIAEARKMGMSDEMIDQEFMCSFDVGNLGSYFTRELADMDRESRIGIVPVNPNLPLHTCWDLGGTDATAGWIFQIDGLYINLVYLLHDSGFGLKYYLEKAEELRKAHRCKWGYHFMPHDVDQKHQGWESTKSRLQIAREHGWHFKVTPKIDFEDGIESMRFVFPRIRIDKNNCALGLRAMREYQREYDELKARFKPQPLENWCVHIMDALRYLSVNYKRMFNVPMMPTKYEVEGF